MSHSHRPDRTRALDGVVALACALLAGFCASCLEQLPRGRSCGDGWWDREYEACDPSSPDLGYAELCRVDGKPVEASCNELCEIECGRCGDGIASGNEACDGDDLRGATCPGGAGTVRCTDACALDFSLCPKICGDGIVNGTDECEPSLSCTSDADCGPGSSCHPTFGECVPDDGFGPNLACSHYEPTAIGVPGKPYASGEIDHCTDFCTFGRNHCSFCGDGVLDDEYTDFVFPGAAAATFPAEICDGEQARSAELAAHCESWCNDGEPLNPGVTLACDFTCNDSCTGFAPPDDVIPGPDALNCCLAKGSPCPKNSPEGVPELPCCAWLDKPEWLENEVCAPTNQIPVSYVCP